MLAFLLITVVWAKFIPYAELNLVDENEFLKVKLEAQVKMVFDLTCDFIIGIQTEMKIFGTIDIKTVSDPLEGRITINVEQYFDDSYNRFTNGTIRAIFQNDPELNGQIHATRMYADFIERQVVIPYGRHCNRIQLK